jgi:WD40 repeat protein
VRTWSLRAGLVETLPRAGFQVMKAHLLDETTLLVTGLRGESRVWDLAESPPTFRVLDEAADARRCTSLRAGKLAIAPLGELQIRDARTLEIELRVPLDVPESLVGVALSPDAARVVVGWGSGELQLLDARTGERLGACTLPDGLGHLDHDERGPLAASGPRVYRWSDPDAEPRAWIDLGSTIRCFEPSPDGALLAVGMEDRRILLLDARDLSTRAELRGHGGALNDLRWLPDGSRLVSCATDRTVRLWDPVTAEQVATLLGHAGNVYTLELSADGRDVYSCSNDETVRRWRGRTAVPR